ncbi:MAG: hypothetical protein AAGA35_02740 [Patescibacteria group bacterium]
MNDVTNVQRHGRDRPTVSDDFTKTQTRRTTAQRLKTGAQQATGASMRAAGATNEQLGRTIAQAGERVGSTQLRQAGSRVQAAGRTTRRAGSVVQKARGRTSPARSLRINALTYTIWGIGMTFWFAQIMLALLSLVGLGFMAAFNGSWVQSIVNFFTENLFAISLDASLLFLPGYLAVLAIGWITLAIASFMYKIAGFEPLGGTHATLKYVTFLCAMTMYALPLANIFPWFILFTLIVWWYPR